MYHSYKKTLNIIQLQLYFFAFEENFEIVTEMAHTLRAL